MTKLILDKNSYRVIGKLSSTLKQKTIKKASELDNKNHENFSPWLSSRLIINAAVPLLLTDTAYRKGEMISDKNYLNEVSTFIKGQGNTILQSLNLPSTHWNIMVDVNDSRMDAIDAFNNARSILKDCPVVNSMYNSVVEMVIPLKKERPSGFDSLYLLGAVFRVFPEQCTPEGVAFELAHGTGHQVALLLSGVDYIFKNGRGKLIDYKARNDQRRAIDAFYSLVALGYMVLLYKSIPNAYEFSQRDPYLRTFPKALPEALKDGIQSIRESMELTAISSQILDELEEIAN
jgi:hypothetical protein